MKTSLSRFYKEVTGSAMGGMQVGVNALARWGIPFERPPGKRAHSDAVDVAHIEAARKLWQAEKAAVAARKVKGVEPARKQRGDPDALVLAQNTRALQELTAAIMLLVEKK
jgi:hypothetical protein